MRRWRKPLAKVEACAKKVVRYGMRGPLRPHSGGIAVYFPLQGLRAEEPHALAYARDTFAGESRWVRFLGAYGAAVKSFPPQTPLAALLCGRARSDRRTSRAPGHAGQR